MSSGESESCSEGSLSPPSSSSMLKFSISRILDTDFGARPSLPTVTPQRSGRGSLRQVVGALFAMLMTAVVVGTSLQIQKDGIMSPHSIFLFSVISSFLVAAILHPLEFTCIIPGILYFLAIPTMYMLLPIYSICNLNNVAWGTREDPRPDEKNDLAQKGRRTGNQFDLVESGGGPVDGELSFGCGSACRLMCCLGLDKMETSPAVNKINEKLNEIQNQISRLERRTQPGLTRRALARAEREELDVEEEKFWTELIDKYLSPLSMDPKEQDRVRAGLNQLRTNMASGFFMLNIVFCIAVLVFQLQKDCLHIEWPFGPKFNHTVIPCNGDTSKEVWVVSRLQLEPIGLVFLVFFMAILVIQFFAMLFHRFGTLAHIIASTELFCCKKAAERISEEDLVVQNAVEIARELQAIRGVDETEKDETREIAISRRRVVQNLEHSRRSMMKRKTETLDAAFKKRFFALSSELEAASSNLGRAENRLTLRRGTIKVLESKRNSHFGSEAEMQSGEEDKGGGRGPAQRKLERLFDGESKSKGGGRVAPLPDPHETARNKF